jgi:hypothetical protein
MMPEGFLIDKLAPALGGLFGGLSLAMFWTPEKLQEKGKVAAVFIAGGISAMAGFAFTGLAAERLGISSEKLDVLIGLAWVLGLGSIAVINWVSNYMVKREHMDIKEIADEIKHKPVTRTRTRVRK